MKREFLREFSFLLPVKFAGSCGRCPYKETKGGGFHQTSPFCYAGRRAVFQKGEKILVGVAHKKIKFYVDSFCVLMYNNNIWC